MHHDDCKVASCYEISQPKLSISNEEQMKDIFISCDPDKTSQDIKNLAISCDVIAMCQLYGLPMQSLMVIRVETDN